MAKAKRKAGSKTTSKPKRRRVKRTRSVRVPRSLLLDLEDELGTLAAAFEGLPELRMLARAAHNIVEPPSDHQVPANADRIGACARELFKQPLDRHMTPAGTAFVNRADVAMATDLAEAAEMIPSTVQWRLHRLEALIRLLQAEQS